ncbi:non-ribosomal peptide synthetase [Nocardia sp. IFM 10818]
MDRNGSGADQAEAAGAGLPLTGPQLGIWNAQRFDPESGRYLVGEVLEISGDRPIDIDLLAEAIRKTVAESENMRLRFRETADGPRQFVTAAAAELRPTIDLRAAADPLALAHEAVALERQRAAEHCKAMVDRQLYIYTLIRLSDTEVWCVQLYHHLIVDGYSAALLSRRVAGHYTSMRRGTKPPKQTFGTIAALVAEEQEYRAGEQFEQDRQFWRDQLTPWPSLDGRGRHVGGAVERTVRGEAILTADTLATLKECADNYGVTWADVLVACYAAFIDRELGSSDVVLSMLLMGRVGRAALSTPSMAVNVLPLRLTVRADDRLGELAPRVAATLREVRAHQRYSGDDLARDFHGYGAGELLHGVGMNLKVFDFSLDFDGSRGVLRNVAGGPPEDLGVVVTPLPDGTVLIGFESDARTNDGDSVRRRVDGLMRVINAFTGADKPPVGALELLDPAERTQLLATRSVPAPATTVELVPEAFDRLVANHPDAIVLASGDIEWTAAEFGSHVNRLANYLRANGIRPDSVVGVALPRSAEFVVALFAIWQAGGIYLPLDPEHPVPRLRSMIADAAPELVLSAGQLAADLAAGPHESPSETAGAGLGALDPGDRARDAAAGVAGIRPTAYAARTGAIETTAGADEAGAGARDSAGDADAGGAGVADTETGADETHVEYRRTGAGGTGTRTGDIASAADAVGDRRRGERHRVVDIGSVEFQSRLEACPGSRRPDEAGARVDSRHGAYLIYTSGSTGRPKGVLVDHGALARLVAAHRAGMYAETAERAGRALRVAHTTSFAFDAALDPLLWMLDGHCVRVYDSEIRRDPATLVAAFGRDRIDVVDGTPAFAAGLLDHGLADIAPRLLALGGDACSPELWQRIQRAGIAAVNLYGPTESTVDAITAVVRDATPHIGQPLPGTRIYLLDNGLQVVADGRIGELYLAGPQLARGYLGRPDATSDRFVADPYGPPGARMYRTGDRARWVPGRGYEYLGRIDNQVKIRGHRVELGEVEAALGGLPEVRAAAADIREIAGRPTLIGYVVAGADIASGSGRPAGSAGEFAPGRTALDSVELRSKLADLVPDHMVPSRLVFLDELPHTVNGKLDRAALPEPPSETGGRAASTLAEQSVCTVVAAALGHDAVSIDDDFFGVGGDSITAISVSSRLRERGLILSPQDLLTRRPLAELAATAAAAAISAATTDAPKAERGISMALPQWSIDELAAQYGPVADVLPLSPLQEGLLFHALRDGDDDIYTMTARFELAGAVDPDRLEVAFQRMLARHPNLGAAFCYEQFDQPVQVVPRTPGSGWRVEDLRGLAVDEAERVAVELEQQAGAERFDIAAPPLLRVLLIRVTDTSQRLVLIAHHLLADGWSVPIMLRETLALYHGEGEMLPVPGYYGDYLAWLGACDTEAAVDRWRDYLLGVPAPSLIGIPGQRSHAVGLRVPLPDNAATALEDMGRRFGLTMNTLLQGAWSMVLAAHLGRTDVVFGTVVSGRPADLPDVETTVGLFSNTVPVRLPLDSRRSLPDQLVDFQRTSFEMQAQGYLGLATVERAVGLGHLFDSLVVFENFPKSGLHQPESHELRVADVFVHSLTHYPIVVTARPGERFDLLLHHDPAAVPEVVATELADRLGAVLTALIADPDATVAAVTETTRQRESHGDTLATWGATIDLAAPAVTAEGVTIDYGDFHARVNRLAHWLISQNVGPETVVAVAMHRCADSVIAAHAIVRSGAVYLPIDPEQPAQRIDGILETAAPAMILTITADGFDTGRAPVVAVDQLDITVFADTEITDAERVAPLRPANSAYLLFTSGSTGVPKGVTVAHESIVNTFEWLQRQQRFGPGDTVLYRTPPTFDASLLELFLPLLVGARIVLTRPNGHKDPYYQAQLMAEEQVTAVQMTTSMLTVLAEETDLTACTALRCVITGGEALPPATAHRVRALTGAHVNNLYGPTEAAVCITYHDTTDADTLSVPIGRPATRAGVRVLDEHLRPVPAGTIGELYLTGIQLARGYLAKPTLTAGSFVADPHGHGDRMYRTGDLVKWNPQGELDYLGRADSQVKLRGQRIELGDIESALLTCEGVAQAAVLLREDTPGDQRLVAYLIARSGAELDTAAVQSALTQLLPAYMIPAAYVVLDHIPRTASEKIDRKALPAPGQNTVPTPGSVPTPGGVLVPGGVPAPGGVLVPGGVPAPGGVLVPGGVPAPGGVLVPGGVPAPGGVLMPGGAPASAPGAPPAVEAFPGHPGVLLAGIRTPSTPPNVVDSGQTHAGMTEAGSLADIRAAMAAVLSVPEIGADDDFFAAGGHSLTAVRLIGRLRRGGVAAVLDDVFAAPTPRALAARISTTFPTTGLAFTAASDPGAADRSGSASPDSAAIAASGARSAAALAVPDSAADTASGRDSGVPSDSTTAAPAASAVGPDPLAGMAHGSAGAASVHLGLGAVAAAERSEWLAMMGSRLDHVLELRSGGAGAPLFCVHPVGGTAWQFGPLARVLRADRAIIGLQLPALGGDDFRAGSLEELAGYYLGTIRSIQPEGPYHLLGYSLGGNVVHAIAARLEAAGESVAFAGLVDSHPLANLVEQAGRALGDAAALDELLPELPEDAPELAAVVRSAAAELLGMVGGSATPRYGGAMNLYAADDGSAPARTEAQVSGWRAAGARLVVRRLPYSHFGIVSPAGWTEVAALLDVDPAIAG